MPYKSDEPKVKVNWQEASLGALLSQLFQNRRKVAECEGWEQASKFLRECAGKLFVEDDETKARLLKEYAIFISVQGKLRLEEVRKNPDYDDDPLWAELVRRFPGELL